MPASQTSVINAALRILGAKRVSSIDQDVKSARILKDAYDDVLEEVLGMHPWKFAMARVELTNLAAVPVFEFSRAYQLPADHVMTREVFDQLHHHHHAYRVEGTTILTDIGPPLQLIYTRREEDMTVWHALARRVLAAKLALDVGEAITGTNSKVEKAAAHLKQALRDAQPTDGQQDPPREIIASVWDEARGVSGPARFPPDDTAEPL